MTNEEKEMKLNLSFEPAYQVIYWSLIWLLLFIGLIVLLEYTRFNWISIVLITVAVILMIPTRRHFLKIRNNSLFVFYIFKETIEIPLSTIERIEYSHSRKVELISQKKKRAFLYLSKKNKKAFIDYLQTNYSSIDLVKQEELKKIDSHD